MLEILLAGGEQIINTSNPEIINTGKILIKETLNNSFITVDTFRYLFSAMAQTLGAIIALSATFFVLIYDNCRKERDNYYTRLIKIILYIERNKGEYFKIYTQFKDNKESLFGKLKDLYSGNCTELEGALKWSSQDFIFLNFVSLPRQGYVNLIEGNMKEFERYFDRLKDLIENIKNIYFWNLIFIGIIICFLTLTDWGFNELQIINFQGIIMLLLGLSVFTIGLILIGKSIFRTIEDK